MTEGLSFHTNLSFDYFTRFDQTVSNGYSVYVPQWETVNNEDKIVGLTQYGADTRPGTQVVGNTYFRRRIGFYGLFDYDRTFDDLHHVSGSLLGYGSHFKELGDFQELSMHTRGCAWLIPTVADTRLISAAHT